MRVRCAIVLLGAVFAAGIWGLRPAQSAVVSAAAAKVMVPKTRNVAALQVPLARLRGPELAQLLDKDVVIEGVFYGGSIPMLVDNLDRVRSNAPLKQEDYVPLVGAVPTTLKWGDRISVKGRLSRPTAADPPSVQKEPSVLRLQASEPPRVLVRTTLSVINVPSGLALKVRPLLKNKYAVLIAGGIDPANNHIRYWNDLKTAYSLLLSKGYAAGNISVIYADGVAKDNSMPVSGAATTGVIASVFTQLSGRMRSGDDLFILLSDHGGSGVLWLWNWVSMSGADFAAQVNKIQSYGKMMIVMEQCYSGGFVGPLTAANRVIMSACSPSEESWATSSLLYDEFVYWDLAALSGSRPDGSGAVNADANGDGNVSMEESYNFARAHDAQSETPQYEDNGAAPCHSGPMPNGGDGAFGANCGL